MTPRLSHLVAFAITLPNVACNSGTNNMSAGYAIKQSQSETATPIPLTPPATPIERTEAALLDQVSCRSAPQAGKAISTMLEKKLVRSTNDGGDGSLLYVPTTSLTVLGYQIIRITGWEADQEGRPVRPFSRGPGTAPPNFIELTLKASANQIRQNALAAGLSEAKYVDDPTQPAFELQGQMRQPHKKVPGFEVEDGDSNLASSPHRGVSRISCSANSLDYAE